MSIRKIVIGIAVAMTATSGAFAKEACGTELCLGGMMMTGEQAENCKEPIKDFFEIVKYQSGHHSPSKTLKARKKFLDSCPSGEDNKKKDILTKFGMVFL